MTWTIHPRTIAKERRHARLLEMLQTEKEGRASIPALRAALAVDDRTLRRDLTDLEKSEDLTRYPVRVDGQRHLSWFVRALWFPCETCAGYGDLEGLDENDDFVRLVPCTACDATGRTEAGK